METVKAFKKIALLLSVAILMFCSTGCELSDFDQYGTTSVNTTTATDVSTVAETANATATAANKSTTVTKIGSSSFSTELGSSELSADHSLPSADGIVRAVDCGQGDCILIASQGKYTLIDAGPEVEAKNTVSELQQAGITRIDNLIFSHPHEDHIGGAILVMDTFEIGNIYMHRPTSGTEPTSKIYRRLLEKIADIGKKVKSPSPGDTFTCGKFNMTILAPLSDYKDLNEQSIVIRAVIDERSFLFMGDAESKSEKDLRETYGEQIDCDVLKVGHHGSKTSSTKKYLQEVTPQYAVISSGIDNNYNHPNSQIVDRLKNQGIKVFGTEPNGETTFSVSNGKISVYCEKPEGVYNFD